MTMAPVREPAHRQRLTQLLADLPDTPEQHRRAEVLENLELVVSRSAAEDFELAAELSTSDREQVAAIQDSLDGLIGDGTGSITTAAVRRLADRASVEQVLRDAGRDPEQAARVADGCGRAAFWLVLTGVDACQPTPLPRSADDLRLVVERQGVAEWRGLLANVAVNPWASAVKALSELAMAAGQVTAAEMISGTASVYRQWFEEDERLMVAQEIRRLVMMSGCSQHKFAQQVGTSGPRLSTYINGQTTPSAAMMLRIRRVAIRLAREAASARGSGQE